MKIRGAIFFKFSIKKICFVCWSQSLVEAKAKINFGDRFRIGVGIGVRFKFKTKA